MYKRTLEEKIIQAARQNPALAILGPRQSGKTTLVKQAFSDYLYFSFENLDTRALAQADMRSFLIQTVGTKNVIFDEFQHIPELLSYLQGIIDESGRMGQFVLTGSQNYLMNERITQSLAGRISLFTLFPLDQSEMKNASILPTTPEEIMIQGCYPRIYYQGSPFSEWYDDYIFSYLERDVRSLKNIGDLMLFKRFMRACASRVGQILDYTDLARDLQISQQTVKSWLSILEASYTIFLLPPYHKNFNKRIIKSPKLYFYETALAARLLDCSHESINTNPTLKGAFFENYVISELMKQAHHAKSRPQLYFWRDTNMREIDCLQEKNGELIALEIKSSRVFKQDMLDNLRFAHTDLSIKKSDCFLVFGGDMEVTTQDAHVIAWNNLATIGVKK